CGSNCNCAIARVDLRSFMCALLSVGWPPDIDLAVESILHPEQLSSRQQASDLTTRSTAPAGTCFDRLILLSDRLILEETQYGPIHRRLPVRQRPNCGVGTAI